MRFKTRKQRMREKERRRSLRLTPELPLHSDIYIVEFPKSGITWLSTILANAFLISSGRSEVATYFNIHQWVSDLHMSRDVALSPFRAPPFRLIKSHDTFNSQYNFVLYIVRNPVDVMKSYYRFVQGLGQNRHSSFDAFCRDEVLGVPAWKRHVNSWLAGEHVTTRLHLVRYEDLIANARASINAISDNFGWGLSQDCMAEAVSRSSLDKMRQSEALYKQFNPRYRLQFVSSDKSFEIKDETVAYIKGQCVQEMKLLGYCD